MFNKLSTAPYKGVRDFFPADMAIEKKIFGIWREVCEKYGYEEYGASVLEPADLYKAKSGEEIVNEQTYTFTDRGDREVTLRPEMTPTVARMVAARKRELLFPLRWYSIPNLFRYEQPQRGRVREHWQLNVDIFGVESSAAEIEVINMAYDITRAYGLKDTDFEIRLNNRKLMDYIARDVFALNEEATQKISKLIDKKNKISKEAFEDGIKLVFADSTNENSTNADSTISDQSDNNSSQRFLTLLNSKNFEEFTSRLPQTKEEHQGLKELKQVIQGLEALGITNVRFDQTLMRGFDYYTGTVFEIFDLNPANRRSVFGGGRYDDLLSLFGNEKVPAFGFGAGDVVAKDLMEIYGALPKNGSPADIALIIVGEQNTPYALDLAQTLRAKSMKVIVDISGKKVSDQIGNASKRSVQKIICIGDEEVKTGKMKIKILATGEEFAVTEDSICV
ncbi:MAG: histidine--tRNA ligase [Candidatus Taylorbacteria bacterium]|nr:histidine--tRNA ligase [Candidatus Taylorbacteria bacterium]